LNLYTQKLEGVYRLNLEGKKDTNLYMFHGRYYKHLYTINSWNGRDTHIRRVEEGAYRWDEEGFTVSDDDWSGEYTLSKITDSGSWYMAVEDQKVLFSKTTISYSEFNSLFKEFSQQERILSKLSEGEKPNRRPIQKLVLRDKVNEKTKILQQTENMEFYRACTDTLLHGMDTLLQVINGYIDSIGDSLVYIKAHAFISDNHYTMDGWYDFNPGSPDVHIEWTAIFLDSTFCFPKSQLVGIKSYRRASDIGNILIVASLANAIASPFYSIDYKASVVNKRLFKTSLLASACVLFTGIVIDIFARARHYSLCKRCPGYWVLAGLKQD